MGSKNFLKLTALWPPCLQSEKQIGYSGEVFCLIDVSLQGIVNLIMVKL